MKHLIKITHVYGRPKTINGDAVAPGKLFYTTVYKRGEPDEYIEADVVFDGQVYTCTYNKHLSLSNLRYTIISPLEALANA